jgi:predicted adenylyl cyclase CyaB
MPQNVEIKARVVDLSSLRERVESIADGPAEVIDQEDTFFAVATGRLKLRDFGGGRGELIRYHRPDDSGPKTSEYTIAPTSEPKALKTILTEVLGVLGVVRKRRWLSLVGQTRIHLDRVEGLGDFLELEVVLRPGQSEDEGIAIAEELMGRLGIAEDDLVEVAYIDLLTGGR